jgi:uncharacterized repeat protein (TIGR01451 family)
MSRFRVGLAVVAIAVGVIVFTGGAAVANAADIPGGDITTVCAGKGTLTGTTYTLHDNCGDVTSPITVPDTITTVNGAGHTISATDIGSSQFNGGILTNAPGNHTLNVENLTVSGPADGFQICTQANYVLFGIHLNDASGSINKVKVEHIWQQPNASNAPSCNTGNAIRADNATAARTVTVTHTTVIDYQKNGIYGRGAEMTLDVSDSTIGPPNPQEGLIAANGIVYYDSTGTAKHNTILGSGDQGCLPPPATCTPGTGGATDATAVYLYGAKGVTVTHNKIGGAKTDIGVAVVRGDTGPSTGSIISFNNITRASADVPDPTGHGIDVYTPDGSRATPICNTFSNSSSVPWNINIVGAEQISCTPLPNGNKCDAYSAPAPPVDSGKNYRQTDPFPIIDATPFTWTVDSGMLPPGLSLSTAGEITGTPTETGTFTFTLKLVDSTGLTATQAQTITIASDCGPPIIDKKADSPTVTAGGLAGFRITVMNRGNVTVRNWWVCDQMPRGLTFVGATRKLRRLGQLRCLVIPTLRPHQKVSFHVTARVASNAPSTLTNDAEVIPGPPAGGTPPPQEPPKSEVGAKEKVRHPAASPAPPPPPPRVTG